MSTLFQNYSWYKFLFPLGVTTGHGVKKRDNFWIFKSVFNWWSSSWWHHCVVWAWNDPVRLSGDLEKQLPVSDTRDIVPPSCCIYLPHWFQDSTSVIHLYILNFIALNNNWHLFKHWTWHGGRGNSKGEETIDKKHMENTFQNSKIKQNQQQKEVPVSQDEITSFNTWIQVRENHRSLSRKKVHLQ